MTASLIVAGYETIGSGANPEYRLAPGFDFGQGDPEQATISSLYLDGETLSGLRTVNRTVTLPILVRGATATALSGYVSTLLLAVSAQTFVMQWTPDGGLPILFDCYRAQWSRPRDITMESQGETRLILTFQAKPFGRSTAASSVTAASAQLQIDSFDTAATGGTLDTTIKYEGTGSNSVALPYAAGVYKNTTPLSRAFSSIDLSAKSSISLRYYLPSFQYTSLGTLQISVALTSAGGFGRTLSLTLSGGFTWVPQFWFGQTLPLSNYTVTGVNGDVNLAAVTGFAITVTATVAGGGGSPLIRIDDLRAMPPSSSQVTTTHAAQLLIPGVIGDARAPCTLALTNGSTMSAFVLHSAPPDQDVDAAILVQLSTASTSQTVSIPVQNAKLRGTFAVLLGVGTLGSGAITATVAFTQYEGGVQVGAVTTLPVKTYTSGAFIIPIAEVTLPLYGTPVDNTATSYNIDVVVTGTDRYSEIMLLDTDGQTVFTDTNLTTARPTVYVDEPTALQSGSSVYTSASTRALAYSILNSCVATGGPMLLDPGNNKFLAWVSTATPTLTATYSPRWQDERVL